MSDAAILQAAFDAIARLRDLYDDAIPWSVIDQGFQLGGETIRFATKAQGIFKPAQMRYGTLSIKTVVPRHGRKAVYNDRQAGDDYYHYALQAGGVHLNSNRYLWQSLELNQPFIYFYGIYPGYYTALWPCYVETIHDRGPNDSFADVYVGLESKETGLPHLVDGKYPLPNTIERRYALRESKHRLHQSSFRQAVLFAYDNKCAMTGLPTPRLLDAAHIIADSDDHGEASVRNGISLSKLHHSAYDKNLIGIDADYQIHVSDQLVNAKDGPLLELGLKALEGKRIALPKHKECWPDRDRLAERFEKFASAHP